MLLLLDIGNTHTHAGLASDTAVIKQANVPTPDWFGGKAAAMVTRFVGRQPIEGAILCSVVPRVTPLVRKAVHRAWKLVPLEFNARTARGVGIDYPKPKTIGSDRLANSIAAFKRFGAPVVVVDFGTAVTFDVVDVRGNYAGGIIAPGLAAMTDYLHEKTALLPRIKIVEPKNVIGKSTRQAMLAGAVFGYRGLVRELIHELKREMKTPHLPVVATGGYAKLIAAGLPEIFAVEANLTLDGLLTWARRGCARPGTPLPPRTIR
jgi:type III pantothenate kinase